MSLSTFTRWPALLLAIQALSVGASPGGKEHGQPHYTKTIDVVVYQTTTVVCTESTTTTMTETCWTEITNTNTDWTEITNTNTAWTEITNTNTAWTEITSTGTDWTMITNTETDTTTETETEITTEISTTYSLVQDPCPTSCSMSVPSVTVYFWPTDRGGSAPSTWVGDTGYTFSSPSVYLYIPTAVGTAPGGATVGPETSAWMLPLRLHQVSTIDDAGATRQLTLSDLGTDCPQSVADGAIATLPPSCNPILAAPPQFSSWAWPCGACGRMGLFDPPYALPTVTTMPPAPTSAELTTTVPPPVSLPSTVEPPVSLPSPVGTGTLIIVYGEGGPTATVLVPGSTGTSTTSVPLPSGAPGCATTPPPVSLPSTVPTTGPSGSAPVTTPPATAAGVRVIGSWATAWGVGGLMAVVALV